MAQEKNFEKRVKKFLHSVGVYPLGYPKQKMTEEPIGYYEKRWGSKMTTAGLPDLHIVIRGYCFDVELKAPRGKLSPIQEKIILDIISRGCTACCLYEKKEYLPYISGIMLDFETFKDRMRYASQSY